MRNNQDSFEYKLTELLDVSIIKYYTIGNDSVNNHGLSGVQEKNIGTPLEIEIIQVYLGPIINSTNCSTISFNPYAQFIRQLPTFPSTISVSTSQAQNSSGFPLISVFLTNLMLLIIYKKNKNQH